MSTPTIKSSVKKLKAAINANFNSPNTLINKNRDSDKCMRSNTMCAEVQSTMNFGL